MSCSIACTKGDVFTHSDSTLRDFRGKCQNVRFGNLCTVTIEEPK
jgi:hypothetical protein